jgi:hypothetical protein
MAKTACKQIIELLHALRPHRGNAKAVGQRDPVNIRIANIHHIKRRTAGIGADRR